LDFGFASAEYELIDAEKLKSKTADSLSASWFVIMVSKFVGLTHGATQRPYDSRKVPMPKIRRMGGNSAQLKLYGTRLSRIIVSVLVRERNRLECNSIASPERVKPPINSTYSIRKSIDLGGSAKN
jgi:hypothetical protein